jgi:cardiolipin synthase
MRGGTVYKQPRMWDSAYAAWVRAEQRENQVALELYGDAPAPLIAHEAAELELTFGNRISVLRDGRETLPAIFSAIRAARHFVHLEYYVVENVHSEGQSLRDLLVERSQAGVQIALIFDALGSSGTSSSFFEELRRHGLQMLSFNPINCLKAHLPYSPNCRDHRKILIADGRLAIVGGINLMAAYEDKPVQAPRPWRDTDLQLEGPAVAQLQRLFLQHWYAHGGEPLDDRQFHPPSVRPGQESVGIIGSAGSGTGLQYYGALLAALGAAKHRVWITAGYFLPPPDLLLELVQAARRKVDVRLLLPSHNDSFASLAVQRSTYTRLLQAGIKIFERNTVILHSKSIIIDRSWSAVGSSNLDYRSAYLNDEVDAIVVGTETAAKLGQLFLSDLSQSDEIVLELWRRRPFWQKLQEAFWRVCQRLL